MDYIISNPSRRGVLRAVGTGVVVAVAGCSATAPTNAEPESEPETVFAYDADRMELPENVAVDSQGAKYVSVPPLGEIRRIAPTNESQSAFATFDIGPGAFLTGVVGLEVDDDDTLYACFWGGEDTDTHGVWRVEPNGSTSLYAELPAGTYPNDILVDGDSLLVTDMDRGVVWRIRQDEATVWAEGAVLEGTGDLAGYLIGANGIAADSNGTVYVSNYDRGYLVEIPVREDGSAGTPSRFVADERLVGADGLAVDVEDNIYVAVNGQNAIRRVSPAGDIETLAEGGDLDHPSDVTFGTANGEERTVFITNLALPPSGGGPSLMRLDVGVPGRPTQR